EESPKDHGASHLHRRKEFARAGKNEGAGLRISRHGTGQMRVLITGGAGFIGSHLCDYFTAKGHSVIAMDNLITGDLKNIEHLFGRDRFSFIKQDVTQYIHMPGRIDAVL